ncbi:hypothetical protein LJR098_003351 [Rhizobium sp. LjRoot98]|uniref:deaminase n=1 Tax=Rhizobium sp. LjRoot98 TaxID=3342345 RepID=UPI003ECE5DBF
MWSRRQFLGKTLLSSVAACGCAGRGFAATEIPANIEAPIFQLTDVEKERHSFFLGGLCALVYERWAIDRSRKETRAAYAEAFPGHDFCEYGGHNIGAFVVNGRNEIVCFALNQNRRENNPLAHAETRAIARTVEIRNSEQYRAGTTRANYDDLLVGFKVYTTLESCTLCSGVMDLANIGEVVFAQEDPGQHGIGNLLYEWGRRQGAHGASRPIKADFFDGYKHLSDARDIFSKGDGPKGATAFLQSIEAYKAFGTIAGTFRQTKSTVFQENAWVLEHVQQQVSWRLAQQCGNDDA